MKLFLQLDQFLTEKNIANFPQRKPFVTKLFHPDCPRNWKLLEKNLRGCVSDHYSLINFMARVNSNLFYMSL